MNKIFLICCCFFLIGEIQAQGNLVKGSRFISVKYGASKYSFPRFVQGELGFCLNRKFVSRIGIGYEGGNVDNTRFNNVYLTPDLIYNIFSYHNKFSLNFGLGAVGGTENLESRVEKNWNSSLIYGGRGIAEIEYCISQKVSLKGEFSQWYVNNSDLGNLFFLGTIGFSFLIN